jgi:hypothetical protein
VYAGPLQAQKLHIQESKLCTKKKSLVALVRRRQTEVREQKKAIQVFAKQMADLKYVFISFSTSQEAMG